MRSQFPHHVTIVYNALTEKVVHANAPVTDDDTESTAKEICEILKKHGIKTKMFPIDSLSDLKKLRQIKTDLIFNCMEDDIGDVPFSSHLVPKIAQEMLIPCTGGTAGNVLLTTNKAATKEFLRLFNIPTPPFFVVGPQSKNESAIPSFPLIVKPVASDGSEGITKNSVVTTMAALKKQVAWVVKTFDQPALVEQFIAGREINVAVIEKNGEPKVLPPSEVCFTAQYQQQYDITDFEAKWRPDSPQYHRTPVVCPAHLKPTLVKNLQEIARKIWQLLDLQGYMRVDFRINKDGLPFVLEINVNPDISHNSHHPQTGFPCAALAAGMSYEQMILTILKNTWNRKFSHRYSE